VTLGAAGAGLVVDAHFAQRFRVGALIGQGGMSRVYQAHDELTGATVALKLLLDPGAGARSEARFLREAELLAELDHPAIVRHVAHGKSPEGIDYLAMEWLAGEDLARRLRRGRLTVDEVMQLLRRCAGALAAAHERGVIHRDLKPSNLFLVEDAVAGIKVLDFGIARRVDAGQTLTRTGAILGTPQYMSPEQVRGELPLSPASDVYALGCIAHECLSGAPPFHADSLAALFVQILLDPAPSVHARCPEAPRALAALIGRTLAKDPAARPRDAAALLAELERATGDLGVASAPTLVADAPPQRATPRDPQLCCVVHAVPGSPTGGSIAARASLDGALAELGVRCEWLVDGSLIAVVSSGASATDQALVAAHAALLIRGLWPGARVALTTGQTEVEGRRPVGEAVERSARLLAAPDAIEATGIWVDPLSARLLERRFALEARGAAYLLASEHAVEDAARPVLRKPTPCVGRESELGILDLVLHGCIAEPEARVVVVTGPPGAGKSRLRHEFLRRLGARAEDHTVLLGAGELMQAGAPYAALAGSLRRLCGLLAGETPAAARARFTARIGARLTGDATRIIDFLAEMCELPDSGPSSAAVRAARDDPAIKHAQIQRAFIDWLTAECAAGPVLLVLDDLQWGDRLTVALIDQALRSLAVAPLLVLALARTELNEAFPRLWAEHHPQEIALRPLGRRACERLVQHMLGAEATPEVVAQLAQHSAGNALYLEEIIRAYADSHDPAPPATVLAMLQARLGRLPIAQRRVLRVASVFGAAFRRSWLHALLADERAAHSIDVDLAALVDAELLEPAREADDLVFRHELTRRAAYALLSDDERRALHRAAGLHLAGTDAPAPRVCAEHLLLGEEPRLAGLWLLRSARQALDNNDLTGAQELAERADEVDPDAPGELAALRAMLAYWQSDYTACERHAAVALQQLPRGSAGYFRVLGDAIVVGTRLNHPEAVAGLLAQVAETHLDEPARRERVICLARAALQATIVGPLAAADALLARLLPLLDADLLAEPLVRAQVEHALGLRAAMRGDLAEYAEHLELVVAAFEEAGDLRNLAVERTTLANCYFHLGMAARAEQLGRDNLAECERLRAPQAIGFARMSLGGILAHRPETREEARRLLAEAEADCVAIAHPRRRGVLHIHKALLAHEEDDPITAATEATRAAELLVGIPSFRAWALAITARALVRQGRAAAALPAAREATAIHDELGALPTAEFLPRLALVETLLALGEQAAARTHAIAACDGVARRAARIADPRRRAHYLEIDAHTRLRALADPSQ
jgi:hypothetical protein